MPMVREVFNQAKSNSENFMLFSGACTFAGFLGAAFFVLKQYNKYLQQAYDRSVFLKMLLLRSYNFVCCRELAQTGRIIPVDATLKSDNRKYPIIDGYYDMSADVVPEDDGSVL
jgi:hypothetical protein